MGWKSTVRSLAAAQRRIEREERRRQREIERQRKHLERMQELERAMFEVEEFENHIQVITSIHKDCGPVWNWDEVFNAPEPAEPRRSTTHESMARERRESYKPSFIDKLFGKVQERINSLEADIKLASSRDEEEYEEALQRHRQEVADWQEQRTLASRILAQEPAAFIEAIDRVAPFRELTNLGSSLEFKCSGPKLIEVTFHPHGEDVIPRETKSLLKSGRLSIKNMPKTRFYEIYQDYVCGCALRVARELFALLPIEMCIITAVTPLLNTATGHLEPQPILSVAMPRDTIETLDFDYLDPSDAMTNFVHNTKFLKTKGFRPVERLSYSSLA